jgi:hypothetical protein
MLLLSGCYVLHHPSNSSHSTTLPAVPSSKNYEHWGLYAPDSNPANRMREPNNVNFPEYCAVANYTEAFGKPSAWGWADTRCNSTRAPFICRRPGSDGYHYNSTTGGTFLLNVSYQGFAAAQQTCKDNGGHLASFSSEAEQAEVEKYYASQGFLFPSFHKFYWMGLNTSEWPIEGTANFSWWDKSPGPNNETYSHWGL